MKYCNLFKLIAFIALFSYPLYQSSAQDVWTQTKGPEGGKIISIDAEDNYVFSGTLKGGVYMSDDYGETWSFISEGLPFLMIEDIIYFGGKLFVLNHYHGIYKTDDLGQTWTTANNGLTMPTVTSIVSREEKLFCATYGAGVFVSLDSGETWSESNHGLNDMYINDLHVQSYALYAAGNGGAYLSVDEGEDWVEIYVGDNNEYIASNQTHVFIGKGNAVIHSPNNGEDWESIGDFGLGGDTTRLFFLESAGPYVVACRGSGIYIASYQGGRWMTKNSSLIGKSVFSFAEQGDTYFAGSDEGVYLSGSAGYNWEKSSSGMYNEDIAVVAARNDTIYAGARGTGVFVSYDRGENWKWIGLPDIYIYDIELDGEDVYVATSDGVYFTANDGFNWYLRNTNIEGQSLNFLDKVNDTLFLGTQKDLFYSLNKGYRWDKFHPNFNQKNVRGFYAASNGDYYVGTDYGVFVSRDGGQSWTRTDYGFKGINVNCLTGGDSCIIAATVPEEQFPADIYVSVDQGHSWQESGLRWSEQVVLSIAVSGSNIFAAVRSVGDDESVGIMFSSNKGKTWETLNEGLRSRVVNDISLSDGKLYAGFEGASVYYRDKPEPLFSPRLMSPADESKDMILTPLLEWEEVENVDGYVVQVAEQIENFEKHLAAESSTTITEFQIPENALIHNEKYYWRVASQKRERLSDWSMIFAFTTEKDIKTFPDLTSPEDGDEDVAINDVFEWEELEDADEYCLQIAPSSSFTELTVDIRVTGASYQIPIGKLDFETEYYWRVRATIHDYVRGWSDMYSFVTQEANLSAPILTEPTDEAEELDLPLTLKWDDAGLFEKYVFQVSTMQDFSEISFEDTTENNEYELTEDEIDYETEYYWRVKTLVYDYESDWSGARKFTTEVKISVEDEYFAGIDIRVSPIPAENQIKLSIESDKVRNLDISVADNLGLEFTSLSQKVSLSEGLNAIVLDVSGLRSGTYYLILKVNERYLAKRFLIVK